MHPQVRQIGPGSCPICGMTLESAVPATDSGLNQELVDMRRRFWIGLPLAVMILVLSMGHHVRALSAIADAPGRLGCSLHWRRRLFCGVAGCFWYAVLIP
jgi:Cu+-exporting ATPase